MAYGTGSVSSAVNDVHGPAGPAVETTSERLLDPDPGGIGGLGHAVPLQQRVVEPSARLHSPVLLQPCFAKPQGVAPPTHLCPFTGSGPKRGTVLTPGLSMLHITMVPFGATAAEGQLAQTGRAMSLRCQGPLGEGAEK